MADNKQGKAKVEADDHIEIQEEGMNETIDIHIEAEDISAEEAAALDQELKAGGGAAMAGAGNSQGQNRQKAGGCPSCG